MSESLYHRAKRMGITDDELGISSDADAQAAAPELAQQAAAKKAAQAAPKKMNGMPIPPGTPSNLIPLYKSIPHHAAMRYKQLWDKFEKQDLTLVEFSIEMECTTNQHMIQHDLENLLVTRDVNRN